MSIQHIKTSIWLIFALLSNDMTQIQSLQNAINDSQYDIKADK